MLPKEKLLRFCLLLLTLVLFACPDPDDEGGALAKKASSFGKQQKTDSLNGFRALGAQAGSSADPIVVNGAEVGTPIDLASLVQGAVGTVTVSDGGAGSTGVVLPATAGRVTADAGGTLTFALQDSGNGVTQQGSKIYFSITFAKKTSSFVKQGTASNLVGASGLGDQDGTTAGKAIVVNGAEVGTPIDLASLVQGAVGTVTVADGGAGSTGVVLPETAGRVTADAGGTLTFALQDSGNDVTQQGGKIYFSITFAPDTTAPTVSQVAFTKEDGRTPTDAYLKLGDKVNVAVTFSEPVTVNGGNPYMVLASPKGRKLLYSAGSNSATLIFRSAVRSEDEGTVALPSNPVITLDGGTIADGAGNAAVTSNNGTTVDLVAPTHAGPTLDNTPPTVAEVDFNTSDGPFKKGDTVEIQVTFQEDVIVNTSGGNPSIALANPSGQTARYSHAAAASVQIFAYTVRAGDTGTVTLPTNPTITLNGGTITDRAGNAAATTTIDGTTVALVPTSPGPSIDGTAPTLSITSGRGASSPPLKAGETATITFTFDEVVTGFDLDTDVTLDGAGDLAANDPWTPTMGDDKGKVYTAIFTPGNVNNTVAINVASGVAQDLAGNPNAAADLTLTVRARRPAIAAAAFRPESGRVAAGSKIRIAVTFDNTVKVTGTPTIAFKVTSEGDNRSKTANYAEREGGKTLIFAYTVQDGDRGQVSIPADTAITLPGGATINNLSDNAPADYRLSSSKVDGPTLAAASG